MFLKLRLRLMNPGGGLAGTLEDRREAPKACMNTSDIWSYCLRLLIHGWKPMVPEALLESSATWLELTAAILKPSVAWLEPSEAWLKPIVVG